MAISRFLTSLAPFRVRRFRFQWPADLLTSWAFDMETLILGWYVLVETNSVFWLTLFASLQFLGTLVAPMFGVMGDRLGRRRLLCLMRGAYVLLAAVIVILSFADVISPAFVFLVAFCGGLIRPSDLVMRNALIGDTMPGEQLMNAVAISRTTMDTARIAGALAGAGLFSWLGLGNAYLVVVLVYAASFLLTLGVADVRLSQQGKIPSSAWLDLKGGLAYVWRTPKVLALMWLAFLVNVTAYPICYGLLPFVAREIYQVDENGLSHLVAAFATGALLGSLCMTFGGRWLRPGKSMLAGIWLWHVLLLIFAHMETKISGFSLLLLIGFSQSMGMIAMSVTLIAYVDPAYRARIMGVRMLAVYGLPLGLFASSGLIAAFGFAVTTTIYAIAGLLLSGLIVLKWRRSLWT